MDKWQVGMEGEGGGRTTLPDGDNIVKIKEVVFVSAEESKSGNPYFKWTLENVRELTLFDYRQIIKYLKKLEAENKMLKGELTIALRDRQNFKDRLLAVKNSAEVRGI